MSAAWENCSAMRSAINTMASDVEYYMRTGFLYYLTKPIDAQKVIRMIKDTLGRV